MGNFGGQRLHRLNLPYPSRVLFLSPVSEDHQFGSTARERLLGQLDRMVKSGRVTETKATRSRAAGTSGTSTRRSEPSGQARGAHLAEAVEGGEMSQRRPTRYTPRDRRTLHLRTVIDRHYGHRARDGREHVINLSTTARAPSRPMSTVWRLPKRSRNGAAPGETTAEHRWRFGRLTRGSFLETLAEREEN